MLVRGCDKHMLEDLHQTELVERIRELREKGERVTVGVIHKYCERQTSDYRKIDAAISHLEMCGELIKESSRERPGRPTVAWRWKGK